MCTEAQKYQFLPHFIGKLKKDCITAITAVASCMPQNIIIVELQDNGKTFKAPCHKISAIKLLSVWHVQTAILSMRRHWSAARGSVPAAAASSLWVTTHCYRRAPPRVPQPPGGNLSAILTSLVRCTLLSIGTELPEAFHQEEHYAEAAHSWNPHHLPIIVQRQLQTVPPAAAAEKLSGCLANWKRWQPPNDSSQSPPHSFPWNKAFLPLFELCNSA